MGPELGRFGSGPSSVICSRMPFVALVCSSLCQIRAKVLAVAALGHLLVIPRPGGFLDTALGFLLLPGDALDVATSSGWRGTRRVSPRGRCLSSRRCRADPLSVHHVPLRGSELVRSSSPHPWSGRLTAVICMSRTGSRCGT